jgi:hypothetical protein
MAVAKTARVKVFNILSSSLRANTLTAEVVLGYASPFEIENAASNLKTSMGDGAGGSGWLFFERFLRLQTTRKTVLNLRGL